MEQLVPFPATVVTESAVLRLVGVESEEPGARIWTQSAAMVCISFLSLILAGLFFVISGYIVLSVHLQDAGSCQH